MNYPDVIKSYTTACFFYDVTLEIDPPSYDKRRFLRFLEDAPVSPSVPKKKTEGGLA